MVRDGTVHELRAVEHRGRRHPLAPARVPDRRRRRGRDRRRPRGGRIPAHRRVGGGAETSGGPRAQRIVRRGRHRPIPGDRCRRGVVRGSSRPGGSPIHPDTLGASQRHRPDPSIRDLGDRADRRAPVRQPAPCARLVAIGHGRRGRRHGRDGARGSRAVDLARLLRGRGAPRPATGARAGVAGGGGARARGCAVHRQDRDAHRGAACARSHRADRRRPGSGARARGARGGRSRPQRHAAGDRSEPVHDRRLDGGTHGAVLLGAQVGRRRVRRSRCLGVGSARHPDERCRRRGPRRGERDDRRAGVVARTRPATGRRSARRARARGARRARRPGPAGRGADARILRPAAGAGEGAQWGRPGDGRRDRREPRPRGRGRPGRRAHAARRRSRCARRCAGPAQRVRPRHAAAEAVDGAGRCSAAGTRSR